MERVGKVARDIELILSDIRSGADDAFSELCDLFLPMLNAAVARFSKSGNAVDEAELAQEARIALYRAAGTYAAQDGVVTFGLYARICVRNALISYLREKSKKKDVCSLDGLEHLFLQEGADPMETLINAETVKVLCRKAREVLSSFECRVFDLYLREIRTEEMAKLLGKSEKSVRNAIHRVRTKLKAAL